jgi:hypothetical protein
MKNVIRTAPRRNPKHVSDKKLYKWTAYSNFFVHVRMITLLAYNDHHITRSSLRWNTRGHDANFLHIV